MRSCHCITAGSGDLHDKGRAKGSILHGPRTRSLSLRLYFFLGRSLCRCAINKIAVLWQAVKCFTRFFHSMGFSRLPWLPSWTWMESHTKSTASSSAHSISGHAPTRFENARRTEPFSFPLGFTEMRLTSLIRSSRSVPQRRDKKRTYTWENVELNRQSDGFL